MTASRSASGACCTLGIGITLTHADEIKAYEEKRKKTEPWIFSEIGSPPSRG